MRASAPPRPQHLLLKGLRAVFVKHQELEPLPPMPPRSVWIGARARRARSRAQLRSRPKPAPVLATSCVAGHHLQQGTPVDLPRQPWSSVTGRFRHRPTKSGCPSTSLPRKPLRATASSWSP